MNLPMDSKPFLIDAVIGNSRFLASMLHTGRMVRMWWPNVGFPQHVDTIRTGVRMKGADARTSWFDGTDDDWEHRSGYRPRTNIWEVAAATNLLPVDADTSYFAVPGEDFIVYYHRFTNRGHVPVSFAYVWYSALHIAENAYYHTTMFHQDSDALVHFRKDYYFLVGSANACTSFQAGKAWDSASADKLDGSEIHLSRDGALEWQFDDIPPGASVQLPIYLAAGRTLQDGLNAMARARSKRADEWRGLAASADEALLRMAADCPIDEPEIKYLYERSILALKLMSDEETGSIIAAPEFDEHFSRCGGYAYCWGRDAAFITTALDDVGLIELSDAFYAWALTAQDEDGSWQQRHYHDGSLAPSWGLQIDEGASILWGMHRHYEALPEDRRQTFLSMTADSVRRGAEFLLRSLDEDNGLPHPSVDLWEERTGQHTYSATAVFGGLQGAAALAELAGAATLAARCRQAASSVSASVIRHCWNETDNRFYRGIHLHVNERKYRETLENGVGASSVVKPKGYRQYRLDIDPVIDASLLGVTVPFGLLPPNDPRAAATADAVERALTSPVVGGIKRYEDDVYIGGNPWIITTLWLAQFRAAAGDLDGARRHLDWAMQRCTAAGLLPEQADRHTGEAAWVVPLTWSHAMFILTVHQIAKSSHSVLA